MTITMTMTTQKQEYDNIIKTLDNLLYINNQKIKIISSRNTWT